MTFAVRPLKRGDYAALRALDEEVMRFSARAFLGFDWDTAPAGQREANRAVTPAAFRFYTERGCPFVAEEAGVAVGFVLAQPLEHFDLEPLVVWVEDISVHPAHHRRGVATALYRALAEWGRDAGATSVLAGIHPDNAASLALHRHVGFAVHHTRTAVWHLDE